MPATVQVLRPVHRDTVSKSRAEHLIQILKDSHEAVFMDALVARTDSYFGDVHQMMGVLEALGRVRKFEEMDTAPHRVAYKWIGRR
jgi:hypothetical protein